MRYLVISDIHGNLEALDAVLAASKAGYDKVLVLGDLVGYGADPNAVIDRVRELAARTWRSAATTTRSPRGSRRRELQCRRAQRGAVDLRHADRREPGLPREAARRAAAIDDLLEICHGSPFDEDAYVFDDLDALRAFEAASRPVCLFGHTHVAVGFRVRRRALEIRRRAGRHGGTDAASSSRDAKYLINAGSVGQPRDGDPRAGAAIVDIDARQIELFRIPYPIEEAQRKIRSGGPA